MSDSSKKLDQLTIEELMERASKRLAVPDEDLRRVGWMKRFVMQEEIKSGDYPMPAALIYDKYVTYCRLNSIEAKNQPEFFLELRHHFDKHPKPPKRYMMSPHGFDMTPEHAAAVKARTQKYYEKFQAKEKLTKRGKEAKTRRHEEENS